jgi:glycosyltransferase involved in cell wall biosynthesis
MQSKKTLRILGIRGLPAAHGGFETFAAYLAPYLISRGWRVVVYCQEEGSGPMHEDVWEGIERVHIPVPQTGAIGAMIFDWYVTWHAAKFPDLCLNLGYSTAVFCTLLRLKGVPNVINMDGIEWIRAKWSKPAKLWLWFNDWVGCWIANHLVADHPEIKKHLNTRVRGDKITTIAYGADPLTSAPAEPVRELGLEPQTYLTVIARPEPENLLLEIVQGFSRKPRGVTLAILGGYSPDNEYHRAVQAAASSEVKFLGPIYDKEIVQALRFHSVAYVHGHQVGGTNPSLVEALGAGNAVIAHDNRFNRWVAGRGASYFDSPDTFSRILDDLLKTPSRWDAMRLASRAQFEAQFTWSKILGEYEQLLGRYAAQETPPIGLPHTKNRSS